VSVATKTRFGVVRAALVLPGSPNLNVPEDPFHEVSGVPLTFAGIGRYCDRPSVLMPRAGASCSG
jgi:hypothetical protein